MMGEDAVFSLLQRTQPPLIAPRRLDATGAMRGDRIIYFDWLILPLLLASRIF